MKMSKKKKIRRFSCLINKQKKKKSKNSSEALFY